MQTAAVLYLRSSKDRNDVSIDAQRRELQALATTRNLAIAGEFVDVVESGKDENRPGYRAMLLALKARERAWGEILILDTSRLARNVHIAVVFRHECAKRGVKLTFAKLPEVNPVTDLVMRQVMIAFDEVHSIMSREKGLAGMAENVRRGFRAGGRAPAGYSLERISTGAVRDGAAVTKSRLVPNDRAPAIAAYLKGRARGKSARELAERLDLELARSSLVGLEWNALTYAGHTVFGVHNERLVDGYRGGRKRRPRAEWLVQRNTHEALISDDEAERILARLERGRGRYLTRATYLLAGILAAPAGLAWHGNRRGEVLFYRMGKSNVKAEHVERAVLERVAADLQGDDFAAALLERLRAELVGEADARRYRAAQARAGELERKIARLAALVPETSAPRPLLAQIEALELERSPLLEELVRLRQAAECGREAARIMPADVREFLAGLAERLAELPREELAGFLRGLIERIELDPATFECRIHYAIRPESGVFVASPRIADEFPTLRAESVPFWPRHNRRRAA